MAWSGRLASIGLLLFAGACESKSDTGAETTAPDLTSTTASSTTVASTTTSDAHTTTTHDTTKSEAPVSPAVPPETPGAPDATTSEPTSETHADDAETTPGATDGPTSVGVTNTDAEATGPGKDTADTNDGEPADPCGAPDLVWRTANKTNYESYPDPGSEECIEFNGCTWEGLFAACNDKMPEQWVSEHNIVAAFPDFEELELHDLCLRKGDKTIVVTVLDTCGDVDCDGCCTQNKGSADELIDLEKYTNERWGVPDGEIEWADLGPTAGAGCE